MQTILFPSSSYDPQKVDESLEREYDAVLSANLFDIVIFDGDKWFDENELKLNKTVKSSKAIYRGWMMKPEQYNNFYFKLKEQNINLCTTPEEYEHFHLFPLVYPEFGDDTAKMLVFPDRKVSFDLVKKSFKRFIVKDYVKSVKGTDFPKYFTSDELTQEEFNNWIETFLKYRGKRLTGGICIKEYLDLKKYDDCNNEYRIFVANNNIVSISRNSGQDGTTPEPPAEFYEKYTKMGSHFYTVDVSETQDGNWKVIEAGDGSVSGLSDWQDYNAFFRSLYYAFK